ncbi:MAG: DOMON-like domain-containing protein [Burkholderiales bacterium]|nr:DOMON-like domain-containing protein [Burkholderiales bacterium]
MTGSGGAVDFDRSVSLLRHPESRTSPIRRIDVQVASNVAGIALRYRLTGDLQAVRWPAPAAPGRADRLWEHTCCEAFVSTGDGSAYREFNFAPSRQWAAYGFRRYREREAATIDLESPIVVARVGDDFELRVVLPLLAGDGGAVRIGLSAVIEADDGTMAYWALRHLPGRPDFHHPDTFTLMLDKPGVPGEHP